MEAREEKKELQPEKTMRWPSAWQELRDRYAVYLRLEKSYTQNTIEAYLRDADKLLDYTSLLGVHTKDMTMDQLHDFSAALYDFSRRR